MAKPYLNKLAILLSLIFLSLWSRSVQAQSYSQLYILISDARTALQEGQEQEALAAITSLESTYAGYEQVTSPAGQAFSEQLDLVLEDQKITQDELVSLSKKLLAFEQEQNPVDLEAEKLKFTNKVFPALDRLRETVDEKNDFESIHQEFLSFNKVWTRNEALVRPNHAHYGKIETNISFLRAALVVEPLDKVGIHEQLDALESSLRAFVDGEDLSASSAIISLSQGIEVLKQAKAAFEAGQSLQGQAFIRDFISAWPAFEQVVSTRNASLYRHVEAQMPLIMIKGQESSYQESLADVIARLEAIDTSQAYSVWDSMLILLREGVEALLIVLSLVGVLRASGQKKGVRLVYAGAGLGLVASLGAALALQFLFPALTAGANREILEGWVGIVAVLMMMTIGAWLHSKSQAAAWQDYMERQMALVVSTGSFVSMFSLSFLAVFREGAETILFYAGILPNISWQDFLMGIGLALALLLIMALAFMKVSNRFPIHQVFRFLGWLIYALAFKMLGVSIHTLQLTNQVSSHHLSWLPTVDYLGIYPSWEVFLPQLGFLILTGFIVFYQRRERDGS